MLKSILFILLTFTLSCSCLHSEKSPHALTSTQIAERRSRSTALAKAFQLDRTKAYRDLAKFTEAPHPMGSAKQEALARYIIKALEEVNLPSEIQEFKATVPVRNPDPSGALTFELTGRNVIANLNPQHKNCTVLLGSHYDSKDLEQESTVGANDSGSSSIALLQILPYLVRSLPDDAECHLAAVWFDGEESYLADWNDGYSHPARLQDNTYGSRHFVDQLQIPIKAFLLLDMIGSEPLELSQDRNSSSELMNILKMALEDLGLSSILSRRPDIIEDDHIPFLKRGIPSLNLINLENRSHWHKSSDTTENLSLDSIESSSRIAIYLASYLSL